MALICWEGFDDAGSSATDYVNGLISKGWSPQGAVGNHTSISPGCLGTGRGHHSVNGVPLRRNLGADAHATLLLGMAVFAYTTLAATSGAMFRFRGDSAATLHLTIAYNATSKELEVWRGDYSTGTLLGTSVGFLLDNTTTVGPGDTRYLEITVTLSDTVGVVTIVSDGVTILDLQNVDTRNGGTVATFDAVDLQKAGLYNFAIDDLILMNPEGADWNAHVGPIRIEALFPTADGDSSQLLGSDANSVANWQLVDEDPHNTTDYVGSATPGHRDLYNLRDLPAMPADAVVAAVRPHLWAAKSDSAAISARRLLKTNTTEFVGADLALLTSYQWYREVDMELNPATGLAWTIADINALQLGFEVRA